VADLKKEIATQYGVLFEGAGVALRGLFLIDTKGIVRHAVINDLPLGRSVDEALRMVDALQFVETHGDQVCPANWKEGDEAMKPTASGVAEYLAKHAVG
jgi:peroxiredoxin (alkyl hydroperoxide reductase subunit C)